jgi:threonine/homoserine/homoserine lactone efflux protein
LVHIGATALGLSAILAASAGAFTLIKLDRGAYLSTWAFRCCALRALRSTRAAATRLAPASLRDVFMQGFLTNVLNPKVALFFLAFLPQFVESDAASKPLAFLFLGLLFNVNGTLWNVSSRVGSAGCRGVAAAAGCAEVVQPLRGRIFVALGSDSRSRAKAER